MENAFSIRSVLSEDGRRLPLDSNISKDETEVILECVIHERARTTAEVGLAKGISPSTTCHGLQINGGVHHHVMDPYQEAYENTGLIMLREGGYSEIFKYYPSFSEEVFPSLPTLDYVFIDGSHLFDYTMVEFVFGDKKLRVGGIVALHDLWMPSLRKLLRYILNNR